VLCCAPPVGLVEADALHAPLSDNAPATPKAATALFRLALLFEIRLSPDISFLQSLFHGVNGVGSALVPIGGTVIHQALLPRRR